jgi:hypothetical protein
MPDMLSDGWSDSDSSQDARDVEMHIVPDDFDESWVDGDEEIHTLPTTTPFDHAPATDRRARVEEEVEPLTSQPIPAPNPAPPPRLHTSTGGPQPSPTLPPWNSGSSTTQRGHNAPTDSHPQPPRPGGNAAPENAHQGARGRPFQAHTFVLGMGGAGQPVPIPPEVLAAFSPFLRQFDRPIPHPQTQTPQPGQLPGQPGENQVEPEQLGDTRQVPPFVDFAFGGIGALPPFFTTPGPAPQPPDGPENGGGTGPGRGVPTFVEFIQMLRGEPPEEKDDPERAKKLVNGLEHVPVGLVQRMTRVDGVPGAHEDSTGTNGGEKPGCAICWDSLLPEESHEDAKLQFDPTTSAKSEHPTKGPDSKPTVSGSAPDDHTSNAIICLPCSHVFHTSCLIPWFSKPKHTTCPTCRFDIDPRNLTYTPPQWRPRPTPDQPVLDPTTATTDAPPHPPSTSHPEHAHEDQPPLDPLSHDGHGGEWDHHPPTHTHVDPPLPTPGFFVLQSQQGLDQLPGEIRNGAPNNGFGVFPPTFEFQFGPQPVFGPPPPPGHPTHGTGATAADDPHDHGDGPQPLPFPDFTRGGVGHAHFQIPGFAANFTLHVPPEEGLDPGRIAQAVRDQALAILRSFAGGGGGPGTGQPTGPAPNPGGADPGPGVPTEWVPPPAPGPTLRQRVETKERKAGLRCDDPSCGIGPSDEIPFPEVFDDLSSPSIKRFAILKDGGDDAVCGHVFHPACLVSADRCAGWGEEDRPFEEGNGGYEVVSCPVCRSVGKVRREVWEEGAKELLF